MSKLYKTDVDGVYFFFCPGCGYAHWFSTSGRSPSFPSKTTGPIWQFNGDFEKPTVRASILVQGQYRCHSFVTDGKIQYLSDCSHSLAGQTKEIPDFDSY